MRTANVMVAPGGWKVEAKQLDANAVLHVTRHGYHVTYATSPEQVAEQLGEAFGALARPEPVAA